MVNEELEYLTTEEILQKEWNYYKKTLLHMEESLIARGITSSWCCRQYL